MKKIKLIIIGILLTIFSYAQDTSSVAISGNSIYLDHKYEKKSKVSYDSILVFSLKPNEVFHLSLFDDCKYCYDSIDFKKVRLICLYKDYPGDRYYYYSESSRIITTHYGDEYVRIEIYPPVTFLDPKLKRSHTLKSN
jgi:hypothetical protein